MKEPPSNSLIYPTNTHVDREIGIHNCLKKVLVAL